MYSEYQELNAMQMEMIESLVTDLPYIRKRLGVSQTQLGNYVGLSRQTISSIERKTTPLSWNNYLALLLFLAANSDDVYYFTRKQEFKYINSLYEFLVTPKRQAERKKAQQQ